MPKHINSFRGGLDTDTNFNHYSNNHYIDATNLRIITDSESASGTLTNMQDSKTFMAVGTGVVIKASATMNDSLIIFANSADTSFIYSIPFTVIVNICNDEVPTIVLGDSSASTYLKVSKDFKFGEDVRVIARYETNNVQKVYWVDGVNSIRTANLADSDINSYSLDKFDIVQKVNLSKPEVESIIGGTLKAGMYQYAYCLYNLHGSESAYSNATPMIPVSTSSLSLTNSKLFKGSNIEEVTDKGVKLKLSGLDSEFDRIRVIRMFYALQESTPEIDIIFEGVVNADMFIVDTGSHTLGTLILEDYRYIPNKFTAKTITTKNNMLFAGNIEEDFFDIDFDARAYRFRAGDPPKLYLWKDVDLTDIWKTGSYNEYTTETWDAIPNDHNAICLQNMISLDAIRDADTTFLYQSNGTIRGGEGPNIKYRFTAYNRPANNNTENHREVYTDIDVGNYKDLSSPITLHKHLGYQRDEIYRFAVVFKDAYGRDSFAKWIGDIRFPNIETHAITTEVGGIPRIYDLQLIVSLQDGVADTLAGLGIVAWTVVRTERTYADATVKDCGYVSTLREGWMGSGISANDPRVFYRGGGLNKGINNVPTQVQAVLEYISPETNYNKNNTHIYNRIDTYAGEQETDMKNTGTTRASVYYVKAYPSGISNCERHNTTSVLHVPLNKRGKSTSLSPLQIGGKSIYNVYRPLDESGDSSRQCVHGSTLLLKLNAPLTDASNTKIYTLRRSYAYPYGGYTYGARQVSIYYPCSPSYALTVDFITVAGGDCHIGWFEYQRGVWSDENDVVAANVHRLSSQVALLLVESKINLKYTVNPTFTQLDDGLQVNVQTGDFIAAYPHVAISEVKGVHTIANESTFTQEFDLYTYNPVYSAMNKSKVFFARPYNYSPTVSIPTRIYRTNKKFNGEYTDIWTKFLFNDLLDLDSKYNALEHLTVFNNKLVFLQDSAVGVVGVEDREVVSTNMGGSTSIGTGGVMNHYEYINTMSGCNSPTGVVVTPKALYYIDTFNNKLCKIADGLEYISDTKSIRTFCSGKAFTNNAVVYYPKYKEVWFYLDDECIVYNENTNTFISRVVVRPLYNFNIKDTTFFVRENTGFKVDHGLYKRATLNTIVNPNNLIVNRYDSILLGTENSTNHTFQTMVASTTNNTCTETTLADNSRRRFHTWMYNKLRDDSTKERLYGNYLKLTFEYNEKELLKIHDIITNYVPINAR